MLVYASQMQNPFSKFVKRAQDGRKKLEPLRTASVKTLKDDFSKIAKEEVEFSKSILKQIIPVDVSIDKNAKGLRKLVPLNISITDTDAPNVKVNANAKDDYSDSIDYDNNDAIIVD